MRRRLFKLFCAGLALSGAFATSGCATIADHTPSFIAKHIGFLAEAKTKAMVERAVKVHLADGAEAAVRAVQDGLQEGGDFRDGEFYVFIVRATDYEVLASPHPGVTGVKLVPEKAPDGTSTLKYIDEATVAGNWGWWRFRNPETGEEQAKKGWVVRVDDLVYGSGAYK